MSRRAIVFLVIAAVLIAAWAGFAWFETHGAGHSVPGPQVDCCLAFGVPAERTVGSTHWYNFSVQDSAGGAIQLRDLTLSVQTPYGVNLTTPAWTVSVLTSSGSQVGLYDGSSGTWESGGSATVAQGQVFALSSAAALSGDLFVVTSGGGSVSVAIP